MANATSFTDTTVAAGTQYRYAVAAYNAAGTSALSNIIDVTAVQAPTVALTSPTNGTVYGPGIAIPLAATATAPNGSFITKVEFYDGTTLLSTNTSSPYSYNWATATAGTHTLAVKAYASNGAVATATVVVVKIVIPATGVTLTTSVPSPQTSATTVTFNADATGGDIGPYEYRFTWSIAAGPWHEGQAFSSSASWNFNPMSLGLTPGDYTVRVEARHVGAVNLEATNTLPFTFTTPPASAVTLTPSLISPATIGTPVTFTAAASGGSGNYEYKFFLRAPGGVLTAVRDYSTTPTWNWSTTGLAAGTYQVVVHARNVGSTSIYETFKSIGYVLAPPASAVTLTPSLISPATIGTPVTFTAAASGGSGNYEYKFFLRAPGGVLTAVRDYSTTPTWNWSTTGLAAGTYQVVVHARNVGSTSIYETFKSIGYVLAPPASAVTLTPSLISPATIGTPVTFTAAASGGSGNYEYKFFLRAPGGVLTAVRDYSTTPTWNWSTTGLAAGTYQVVVHARNVGSTFSYETFRSIDYALAPPASTVTLIPSLVSPKTVGTSISFTGAASGGSGSYEYKFFLRVPGGALTAVRDYSTTPTWNWSTTGLAAGTYQVVVHARNVGSTFSYETFRSIDYTLQ